MNEVSLKNRLGIFVALSHFILLLLVIVVWLAGGFLTEEMTTTVAIVAPFLATYTTAIIKYIVESRTKIAAHGKTVTGIFAFMSFCLPGLFVSVLAVAILLKAFNIGLRSFEDFKIMLGTTETIFGAYVGQLLFSLFERPQADNPEPAGAHHDKVHSPRWRRWSMPALMVACLLVLPILLSYEPALGAEPSDQEVVATVKDYVRAKDAGRWMSANLSRLTPDFLAGMQRLADQAAMRGNRTGSADTLRFAQIARLLAATALLQQGDRPKALHAFVAASDIEFMLANSSDEYAHVRQTALDSAAKADSIGEAETAFRARVIAADLGISGEHTSQSLA